MNSCVFAAQGVFRGAAGVARGGADDVEHPFVLGQNILEGVAQKLHGDVFEGHRRALGQAQKRQIALQRLQGGDFGRAERVGVVALVDQVAQIAFGNVVGVQPHDLEGQLPVAHSPPLIERQRVDSGILRRHHQAAVGGQPAKQNFAESHLRGGAARAYVFHVVSPSIRCRFGRLGAHPSKPDSCETRCAPKFVAVRRPDSAAAAAVWLLGPICPGACGALAARESLPTVERTLRASLWVGRGSIPPSPRLPCAVWAGERQGPGPAGAGFPRRRLKGGKSKTPASRGRTSKPDPAARPPRAFHRLSA